jgi:predicted DNA-binding transcriptional regulator AlpA
MDSDKAMMNMRSILELFDGVSRKTVYGWMSRNGFPSPFKIGGKNYWKKSEVEAYIRAQRPQTLCP